MRNFVTSVQNGKSVEVCCLYCNKVYKSEADLKPHINRCKERGKDLEKRESPVIIHPPSENRAANMTREYIPGHKIVKLLVLTL